MPSHAPARLNRRSRSLFAPFGVLAIWLGFVVLLKLPNDLWSIRVAGMSLDWWYGGLVAPLLIISVVLCGGVGPAKPLASQESPSRNAESSDHPK